MNKDKSGIKANYMDLTANPGEDFYRYANGAWIDKTEIPPAYPIFSLFHMLRDTALDQVNALIKELAETTDTIPGSNAQKIGDFFASGMNEAKVESDGAKPLLPELAYIDAISKPSELPDVLARLHRLAVSALFGLNSGPDFENSRQVIAHVFQGGLGLPDRDYYLNDDEKSVELREKYFNHIESMLKLVGEKPWRAHQHARAVIRIETALATASMSNVDQRDPHKLSHKMSVSEFEQLIPSLDVRRYFEELGTPNFDSLNVMQPDYFQEVDLLLTTVPIAEWKSYLRWHVIHNAATCLSSSFVNETFDFYDKTLQGTKELQPRWKRIVNMTNEVLGEAVGQFYVERYFPPSAKTKMQEMVANLREVLRETLTNLTWMTEPTRQTALEILGDQCLRDSLGEKTKVIDEDQHNSYETMIGYPDKWIDYSELVIDNKSFMGNLHRAAHFATKRDLEKIGQPVDRQEWHMTPQTVNAEFDPLQNQLFFPAAILQPPFFDPNADDATNHGGIVMVIGHEAWHRWDDQGRKFNPQGNLEDWWIEEDSVNFTNQMAHIIEQFNGFTVSGGKHVDGDLVCGEAVADLGGLTLAYRTLQKVLATTGRSTDDNGFTDEQRFFISFAQVWASKARPEYEQLKVLTDPHPPARYRVMGTLAHMPEFIEAFELPADCKMILPVEKRCRLW